MLRIAVIGGGPGGYTAAFAAAKAGAEVTLIEASAIGGTCLNWGCIPTKSLRASADALENAKRLAEFGIDGIGEAKANMKSIMARKDRISSLLRGGLEKSCAALKVRLVYGKAELLGSGRIRVNGKDGTQELECDRIIIATGSRCLDLPNLQPDHERILSSDDALKLESVPQRLVIVGGGVIGAELAFIYNSFGAKVSLVEGRNRLLPLPAVDEEISKLLLREAKKKGIQSFLEQTVTRVEKQADGSIKAILASSNSADINDNSQNHTIIEADAILVAVGRAPASTDLGLQNAGVATDSRGWIIADEHMQTSAQGIFAIGDALGPAKVMLAHVAAMEGLCAAANCFGKNEIMDYRAVPSAIFTSPEIGCAGLSEQEAHAQGFTVKTAISQLRELGKAQAMGEIAGFCKVVCEAGSGKLLGIHITGAHATELVAEATLAISTNCTASDLAKTMHAHPTLSEAIYEAAMHCGSV